LALAGALLVAIQTVLSASGVVIWKCDNWFPPVKVAADERNHNEKYRDYYYPCRYLE